MELSYCECYDLFVLLLYVRSQQLWSWWDGQFTKPHFSLGKLEQAVNQYFVHILSLVTDNNEGYDNEWSLATVKVMIMAGA